MSLPTPSHRSIRASSSTSRVRRHAPLGALVAVAVLLSGPQAGAPSAAAGAAPAPPSVADLGTGPTSAAPVPAPVPAARTSPAGTRGSSDVATSVPTAAPVPTATPTPAAHHVTTTPATPTPATTTPATTTPATTTPAAVRPAVSRDVTVPVVRGTGSRPAASEGGMVVGIGTPSLPVALPGPTPVGSSSEGDPLTGRQLYADTQDWTQQQALRTLTGPAAAAVRALAVVPQAKWVGPNDQVAWIADYVARATAAGQLPQLVLYAIPGRDCGSFSAGGFTSTAQYLSWVSGVRTAIAGRDAVVVVEPDALAQGSCSGSDADTAARIATIASAVDILTADPGTAVYIDAGHEWWMTPQVAAARLVAAHVQRARGFSLDVSNFYATAGEVAFGQEVAALVTALDPSADPHFVVDTSRNGAGPAPAGPYDWCNPTGRLLGAQPGAVDGQGALDGYLWVKHPGESDGSCHPGDPGSGQWYPGWAVDIVARSVTAGLLGAG